MIGHIMRMGLTALFALALPLGAAARDSPGPAMRYQFRAGGLPVAGPAEVVTFVFDFAPGAQTAQQTPAGLLLATVLEGELTVRANEAERPYRPGETLVQRPGEASLAANRGRGRARAMVSAVGPQGAPPLA